ncbi:CHASE3 domain-containing protein [Bradyrhizobium oligotrophicum]|uniref:CHASE3 domain-containing protein n=1 Tax=Bradyrhizobium oligotrophicum TaxID=44255 RepID=UPI003EC02878
MLTVGFLTLLGIIGSTAWLAEQASSYFEQSNRSRSTRGSAVELRNALQSAESSQRGYLVGGNEIYLAPYDAAKAEVLAQFDRLNQLLPPSAQNATMLGRLSKIIPEKLAEMDRSIRLKRDFQDSEAATVFRSNRGKALMDEANLFLSSIIRGADDRLDTLLEDQRRNATLLRLATIIGGLIIVLVVGGATAMVFRYAWEVSHARNELNALNLTLEQRVVRRTAELAEARDRAELLVTEVNHRVANSLALVASLVRLQSNLITDRESKDALKETEARILAVASVHKRLYSGGDARFVDLQEYLTNVLENVEASMRGQGHVASLRYDLEPLKLKTDWSINLGVIVNEWVTNAFKYAYPEKPGEVRVRLRRLAGDKAELSVEDDGVGRADGPAKGTGLGTRIVNAMARSIGGDVEYVAGGTGTVARLAFSAAREG